MVTSCDQPYQWASPKIGKKFDGGKVMQHLPKQAVFLGRALQACLDYPQQPLPDELNVLLCFLDGAERRRRIQAALNAKQRLKLDLPADVHWMPADEVREAGPSWRGHERHFESLRRAADFVMHELTIADRANVMITTEDDNLAIEQIEKLQ
jgi:hypothetical protein